MAMCDYILQSCESTTLSDLCAKIDHGLKTQACSFSDVFLFLYSKYDSKSFNETIEHTTKNCLGVKNKNTQSYYYFRNNLLNSNIWSINRRDDKNCNNNNSINENKSTTIFGKICQDFESTELKQQQTNVKQELTTLQRNDPKLFDNLQNTIREYNLGINNEISHHKVINKYKPKHDYMNDKDCFGIHPSKQLNELPVDFEHDFYGKNEYDYKVYLTKLLIAAHEINPTFQQECKEFFDKIGREQKIECKFTEAPVKTSDRCSNKAKIDYGHREWPHCSHILDYIRCSVVFDDLKHFPNGFKQFYTKYTTIAGRRVPGKGCIKGIVRVKNDFIELPRDMKDVSLSDCHYRDIKCNVLVENSKNGIRIIGEVQFILNFMLETKKEGHKIYALLRKKELYEQLNSLYYDINNNPKKLYEYLNVIILNHNINQLSLFFQTMSEYERKYFENDKNRIQIENLLNVSNFSKGLELFKFVFGADSGNDDNDDHDDQKHM